MAPNIECFTGQVDYCEMNSKSSTSSLVNTTPSSSMAFAEPANSSRLPKRSNQISITVTINFWKQLSGIIQIQLNQPIILVNSDFFIFRIGFLISSGYGALIVPPRRGSLYHLNRYCLYHPNHSTRTTFVVLFVLLMV